jgi:predicted DNA-binding transcriptional regulator AlpA
MSKGLPGDVGFGFLPRGLRLPKAAAYVGVSETQFKRWVDDGLMPKPFKVGDVTLWDARKVDSAFDNLPGNISEEESEWEDIHA